MCGICGIINFNNNIVEKDSLQQMMKIMKHRGPDDEGIFISKNIGFGHVRLSIIDLSTAGHQPMFSKDGRYILIFNGEIYNYIELKIELKKLGNKFYTNTDSEVLLISYIQWGKACLHRFNGMWAFAIYDTFKKELFTARDRYGIKPFYYYLDNQRFIFASEIPPILELINKVLPDKQVIYDYLVFNRTDQTESTFFTSIKKLQHGSQIVIKHNKFELQKWYKLVDNLKEPFKTAEEFRDAFKSSVGLRLRSDVPVGVCLSGGLDSSSIVSVLLKDYSKSDLQTFSAIYGEGVYGDESKYIRLYNDSISNMNFIQPSANSLFNDMALFIKAHGEPVSSTSPYAQYKVMELASKHVVVTLDGQGADEELAGYHYFFGFYFKELLLYFKWLTLINEQYTYLKNHKSLYGLTSLIYLLLPAVLKNDIRVNQKVVIREHLTKQYSKSNTITANLYSSNNLNSALINHFEYKLEHLLKWEDRNSMHFSLEARVPFLDYRIVEKTLSLPSNMLIKDGSTKYILRNAMKGTLPEAIRSRKDKIGFRTPADSWFREKIFYNYIKSLLLNNNSILNEYINTNKAWSEYQKHLEGKINIGKEIWKWINLELWLKQFVI